MNEKISLLEAYKQTDYKIIGHGKRDMQVLKDAFENVEDFEESDMYGSGKVIEEFQEKMALYLGKEAAVFFPSGTMAQLISLRIWCDQKKLKTVAYHPLSHLEIHEEDALKELHHIKPILLANRNRIIEFEDVVNINEEIACLLLELPQREIGGQLPTYDTLQKISLYCREKGIKLHLDGARLFEILPFYQKTAAEICSLFDSVYISLYKGIGGIAGAILAGDLNYIKDSKVWKRRHGGDLISLYPYIVSADYYFEKRKHKMNQYYEDARELAGYFNLCTAVSTLPKEPVSNMFHVHFHVPNDQLESILVDVYEETGVGLTGNLRVLDETSCYFEVSIGDLYSYIPKEVLYNGFKLLSEKLRRL